MIRILLADDHAIVRSGIRQILSGEPDFVVEGEACNGSEAITAIRQRKIDLLLTDISMPGISGPDLIRRIHAEIPELPIVVLSMHNEPQVVARALRAGASGYITKDSDPGMLCSALRKVAAGGRYIDPGLVDAMVFGGHQNAPPHEVLSDREYEVLECLCKGLSLNEISVRLHISAKTVGTHKARLMQKLNIENNADLIRYGLEHGLS